MRRYELTGGPWFDLAKSARRWMSTQRFCVILLTIAAAVLTGNSIAGENIIDVVVASPLWSADQVGQWSADRSPAARMLDSERAAAAAGIDRDNAKQCAQASLKQQVMSDFASHERNRAAADGLEVYYRIVGLARQRQLLVEAMAVFDRLISMAEEAETLGLSDEDPNDLRRQRLATEDKLVQLDSGVTKLRLQMAQLTGRSFESASEAILITPLLMDGSIPTTEEAMTVALSERADLRAMRTLAQRLNQNTLPAARDLLAAQNPGLGMIAQTIPRLALLACLGGQDSSQQDLRYRQQQCHQLALAREEQIKLEVLSGLVDLVTARDRGELARQRSQLAMDSIELQKASIQLDQAVPGSELLIKLEMLTAEGDQTQHQIDEAVARVRLMQAQGIAATHR